MALVVQEINKMGDANCPECGGGYTCDLKVRQQTSDTDRIQYSKTV